MSLSSKKMTKSLIGIIQMTSTNNKQQNLHFIKTNIKTAFEKGVQMLFIPESFAFKGLKPSDYLENSEPLNGPFIQELCSQAKQYKIWLSLGGFCENRNQQNDFQKEQQKQQLQCQQQQCKQNQNQQKSEKSQEKLQQQTQQQLSTSSTSIPNQKQQQQQHQNDRKIRNTHIIINSSGEIVQIYEKLHLFNVEINEKNTIRESNLFEYGQQIPKILDSPVGKLGLSICYDLRFPEYYRLLTSRGAQILLVPSAFLTVTGQAHWEILLRSRAIENQCFVIAAAQTGWHNKKRESYGHSLVVDPWGKVLLDMKKETGLGIAEIDLDVLFNVRKRLPALEHIRKDMYQINSYENYNGNINPKL